MFDTFLQVLLKKLRERQARKRAEYIDSGFTTVEQVRVLPLAEQLKHVDIVTYTNGADSEWRNNQCPPGATFNLSDSNGTSNGTSIGNLAWISQFEPRIAHALDKLRLSPKAKEYTVTF